MTTIEFLCQQIEESRNYLKKMISEMPEDQWFDVPDGTDKNFAWQIAHVMVSQHFHLFSCVMGPNPKILEKVPLKQYMQSAAGLGSPHRSLSKELVSPKDLIEQFDFVHKTGIELLRSFPENRLREALEPIPFKHINAQTKYDALSWTFKHEMWHASEMEQIKIALNHQTVWMEN